MISVVCVTCNRLHLFRDTIEKVIANATDDVKEIVLWNNASTDDTPAYLDGIDDPRVRVVHHPDNIGTNAYAQAFELTTQPYLIELDDDIIDAPQGWDRMLLDAYQKAGDLGFLASNIVNDGKSIASQVFYERDAHLFEPYEHNGVRLLKGPVGGYCTMTDRETMRAVGGFPQHPDQVFFHEDAEYANRVQQAGKRIALLADLKVFHASGPAYSSSATVDAAKAKFYEQRDAKRHRKRRIKRWVHALPLMPAINRRYKLYAVDFLDD
ncbi:MAG: glycosyltransferase [Planctomycetota bacterium]